jgi:hypothetical protein
MKDHFSLVLTKINPIRVPIMPQIKLKVMDPISLTAIPNKDA